jgi:hypothetical protein
MKVCKYNIHCNFATSSYLLGVGTQSCFNTGKCPHEETSTITFPYLTNEQAKEMADTFFDSFKSQPMCRSSFTPVKCNKCSHYEKKGGKMWGHEVGGYCHLIEFNIWKSNTDKMVTCENYEERYNSNGKLEPIGECVPIDKSKEWSNPGPRQKKDPDGTVYYCTCGQRTFDYQLKVIEGDFGTRAILCPHCGRSL